MILISNQEGIISFDQIFKALGDPHRLQIIHMLKENELNAGEVLESIDIVQSTLSHHMKTLVESGLVNAEKRGKWTYYTLNLNEIERAAEYLLSFIPGDESGKKDENITAPSELKKEEDPEVVKEKAAGLKNAEERAAEPKNADEKAADVKSAEEKAAEEKAVEDKDADGKSAKNEDLAETEDNDKSAEEYIKHDMEKIAESESEGQGAAVETDENDDDDDDDWSYGSYFKKKAAGSVTPRNAEPVSLRNKDTDGNSVGGKKKKEKNKDKDKEKGKKAKKGKKNSKK